MRRFAIGAAIVVLGFASSEPGRAQQLVPGSDPEFPRLKCADSLVSLNDRCIVAKRKLNPKIRPVYVSGQPIGFC
jgi:hypothetical protein